MRSTNDGYGRSTQKIGHFTICRSTNWWTSFATLLASEIGRPNVPSKVGEPSLDFGAGSPLGRIYCRNLPPFHSLRRERGPPAFFPSAISRRSPKSGSAIRHSSIQDASAAQALCKTSMRSSPRHNYNATEPAVRFEMVRTTRRMGQSGRLIPYQGDPSQGGQRRADCRKSNSLMKEGRGSEKVDMNRTVRLTKFLSKVETF
jgi:hypothetical protein